MAISLNVWPFQLDILYEKFKIAMFIDKFLYFLQIIWNRQFMIFMYEAVSNMSSGNIIATVKQRRKITALDYQ